MASSTSLQKALSSLHKESDNKVMNLSSNTNPISNTPIIPATPPTTPNIPTHQRMLIIDPSSSTSSNMNPTVAAGVIGTHTNTVSGDDNDVSTLISPSNKSSSGGGGLFEASFTGLDLYQTPTNAAISASEQYLKWKEKQKEQQAFEEMEEKRMNTRVNYILANQALETIMIDSNSSNSSHDDTKKNITSGGGSTHLFGMDRMQNLEATLSRMHGSDHYGGGAGGAGSTGGAGVTRKKPNPTTVIHFKNHHGMIKSKRIRTKKNIGHTKGNAAAAAAAASGFKHVYRNGTSKRKGITPNMSHVKKKFRKVKH